MDGWIRIDEYRCTFGLPAHFFAPNMKRIHLPQITNSSWFPSFLTRCVHEFMSWFVLKVQASKPFIPVIEEGLTHASQIVVLDHRSGAGFETVDPFIDPTIPRKRAEMRTYHGTEVGLHLSVNAFHQLRAEEALTLLRHIAEQKQPIAIVEGNNDSLWQVFGMVVIVPLTVLFTAPFVQPFRWERLVFTYLFPILPLVTFLDGFLALFKLYAPVDLDELTAQIQVQNYAWRSGKLDNGRGGKIIYLLGWPED